MGIASVVLGILGILLSWISCLWPIIAVHVLIGLGLGIGDVVAEKNTKKDQPTGVEQIRQNRISMGVADICLNVIAVVFTIMWQIFWATYGFGVFIR